LVGLQNLGNTCFMNACLQCLMHTEVLAKFFLSGSLEEMQLCYESTTKGAMANAFADLIRYAYRSPSHSSVSPAQVKKLVSKYAPHFSGYGQQDCQEFLRFLLDGLSEDLNQQQHHRHSCPEPPLVTEDVLRRLPPAEQADHAWAMHLGRNDSPISSTFCGQLQSRVTCLTCGRVSLCFDPFFDLSVPVATVATSSNK
ncbi:unnamed protein product, partial [Discosporangium mesarthrocarpum]